jgi:hypothetical protein
MCLTKIDEQQPEFQLLPLGIRYKQPQAENVFDTVPTRLGASLEGVRIVPLFEPIVHKCIEQFGEAI